MNLRIPLHPHISKTKGDEYIPSLNPDEQQLTFKIFVRRWIS